MDPAHFTLTQGGGFMPTRFARSHWGDDHLNGPSVADWPHARSNTAVDPVSSCRLG
jgi:hypothetical protein